MNSKFFGFVLFMVLCFSVTLNFVSAVGGPGKICAHTSPTTIISLKQFIYSGESCQRRGIAVGHTTCDNWCADRATIGSCNGGLACCVTSD